MTIGTELHNALGMLKMVSGQFQSFATRTQDPMAKQMYQDFNKKLDQMVNDLNNRTNYVESQEPQYKMENMTQQAFDQQQAGQQSMRKQ
ncbi:MAG: DUF1657 domain-containing protein [Clostridiales bacterium]|nr:DUF1657 domain-containing protein [Clostridiales bacterium]MCF8023596.1 DUF1657 domain-containing protein [Clostridiales bacterium]